MYVCMYVIKENILYKKKKYIERKKSYLLICLKPKIYKCFIK